MFNLNRVVVPQRRLALAATVSSTGPTTINMQLDRGAGDQLHKSRRFNEFNSAFPGGKWAGH